MKISQLVKFDLDETSKNRVVSNQQGQNLGKRLASKDPAVQQAAQQELAIAKQGGTTQAEPAPTGSFTALPGSTNQNKKSAQKPVNLGPAVPPPDQVTPDPVGTAAPGTDLAPTNTTAQPDANKPKEPGALKKAWDYANSAKSGEDVSKFGRGMADAAGSLNRGAQGFVKGASDLGSTIAQGVGNVGSSLAGGATQMVGAAAGGLGRGYHTARSGNSFANMVGQKDPGSQPYQGDQYQGDPANTTQSTGQQSTGVMGAIKNAAGVNGGQQQGTQQTASGPNPEIADLKRRVGAINQRLDKIQQTVKQVAGQKAKPTTPQLTNNPSPTLANSTVNQATVPVAEGLLRPHIRRRAS